MMRKAETNLTSSATLVLQHIQDEIVVLVGTLFCGDLRWCYLLPVTSSCGTAALRRRCSWFAAAAFLCRVADSCVHFFHVALQQLVEAAELCCRQLNFLAVLSLER